MCIRDRTKRQAKGLHRKGRQRQNGQNGRRRRRPVGASSPLQKVVRRTSKFYAHDEHNECRVGDIVEIMETRPLSKLKRWRVVRIVQRAKVPLPVAREEVVEETEEQVLEEALHPEEGKEIGEKEAGESPSPSPESEATETLEGDDKEGR